MKLKTNKDMYRNILNMLDDKDLMNFCSSNKELHEFCNTDQILWMNRIYKFYPYIPSEIINNYKNIYDNWSEYYIDLRQIKDGNLRQAMHYGAINDRLDLIMIVINLYSPSQYIMNNTLLSASKHGNLDIVKYLHKKGASVITHDMSVNTPLHWAAKNGYLDVVKYLIEKGSPTDARNDQNYIPIDLAFIKGHKSVEDYLMNIK